MEAVIGALASFIGVLVGAFLAQAATGRHDRMVMTADLHRELHSPAMIDARYAAAALVEGNRGLDYAQLRELVGPQGIADLRKVMYYFQRLWLSVETGTLHDAHVPRLFGDTFSWWYENTFKEHLVGTTTEVGRDVEALHTWLLQHSTAADRALWQGADLAIWRRPDPAV